MKSSPLYPSFLIAAAFAVMLAAAARGEDGTNTITFSDPSKPGTVKIQIARGNLQVRGTDTAEVSVKSNAKPVTKAPRKDGLRVLTASSSFALSEKDNIVTLDAASDGWQGGGSDFVLTVPRTTSIIVSNSWGGAVSCANLSGDLEINCLNGEVKLDGISGGAVVSTMNGEIRASVLDLRETKPLSFTSMNGEVVIRVPSSAKANVRLRTQNGSILTDFDEAALVTKTETAPRTSFRHGTRSTGTVKGLPPEAGKAIRDAARVAVQVSREAVEALREGIEAGRENADTDHGHSPTPRAPRTPTLPDAPVAPVPPMPAVPTITGGKLVTGTLNGGGPEISVATMNGDVTLRQLETKK